MTHSAQKLAYTLEEAGLRYSVLSRDELPGGAITWLRVVPAAADLSSAMLVKDLVIQETGVVARLRVCNTSREPVLLPADLVVDGGKQARVVERSVIIPAHAVAEVAVRCVEQGRWHPRDARTSATFAVASAASTRSREHLTRLKKRTMETHQKYELDQQEVWTHVASELSRTQTLSGTQSYTACLSLRATRLAEARRLDIQPPTYANGLALVRPSGAVWIEIFPTREAMGSVVPTVVADVLEDADAPRAAGDANRRADDAMRVIASSALTLLPPSSPATIGDTYALDRRDVAGFVLLLEGRVAHLVATVNLF